MLNGFEGQALMCNRSKNREEDNESSLSWSDMASQDDKCFAHH